MNVFLTPQSQADLRGIAHYIAQNNKASALKIVSALSAAAQQIGDFPYSYPVLARTGNDEIRYKPYQRYSIFYRIYADQVEILHILHAAQQREAILFFHT